MSFSFEEGTKQAPQQAATVKTVKYNKNCQQACITSVISSTKIRVEIPVCLNNKEFILEMDTGVLDNFISEST